MFFRKKYVKSNIKQVISVTYMCNLKGICMISTRRQQHLVPHTNTLGNLWKSSKHLWDVLVMFRTVGASSKLNWKPGGGGGGGYSHILPIRVCATQRGLDFEARDLEQGIHFRGVFQNRGKKLWITALSSALIVADYEEAFI